MAFSITATRKNPTSFFAEKAVLMQVPLPAQISNNQQKLQHQNRGSFAAFAAGAAKLYAAGVVPH